MNFRPSGQFEAKPLSNWNTDWSKPIVPSAPIRPAWADDVDKQKAFGIALGQGLEPFAAACEVFPTETGFALWASRYWVAEPTVLAARDVYRQVVDTTANLLDKNAFSVKLLKLADEKDSSGRFYANDTSDRLKALELYAKIQGFIVKEAAAVINNSNNNNEMKIILVEAVQEQLEQKIIEQQPLELEDFTSDLQLVG